MWMAFAIISMAAVVLSGLPENPQLGGQSTPQVHNHATTTHASLGTSSQSQLKALGVYEQQVGRGFTEAMVFRDMPRSVTVAKAEAQDFVPMLQEYAKQGIRPLVVFEPEGLDLHAIDKPAVEAYFDTLKAAGVSDEDMGTWIVFPEPNIPEWHNASTDPEQFVRNATMVGQALKVRFAQAEVAILLDSQTYPSGDTEWAHGTTDVSRLLSYVTGFPEGLINEVGLQGFAWAPMAGEGGAPNFDAASFLPADSLIALARKLAVTKVLFNTGTFASMYDWLPGKRVSASVAQRRQSLESIEAQAQKAQQSGLDVLVVLFAEDKSAVEADWSYDQNADAKQLLQAFIQGLTAHSIVPTIFDPAP